MRKVHIDFTKSTSWKTAWFSWLIRAVEGTPYSHVRLRFKTRSGLETVYEASGTSVKFIGPLALSEKPVKILDSFEYEITQEEFSKMIDLCVYTADLDYGYTQLFGILLVRLFGLKKNPLSQGRKSQVCSEIVGRFIQEILGFGYELDLDVSGPRDIHKTLSSHKLLHKKVCSRP